MTLIDTRYRLLSEGALYAAETQYRLRLQSRNPAIRAEAEMHLREIQQEWNLRRAAE